MLSFFLSVVALLHPMPCSFTCSTIFRCRWFITQLCFSRACAQKLCVRGWAWYCSLICRSKAKGWVITASKSPSDSAKSSGGPQVARSYLHYYNKEEELRNEHISIKSKNRWPLNAILSQECHSELSIKSFPYSVITKARSNRGQVWTGLESIFH